MWACTASKRKRERVTHRQCDRECEWCRYVSGERQRMEEREREAARACVRNNV